MLSLMLSMCPSSLIGIKRVKEYVSQNTYNLDRIAEVNY